MSRWIEADALINDLEHDISIDLDILNYVGTEGAERTNAQFDKDCKQNAIDLLLRQPSIDLVRCAECKHLEVLNARQLYAVCQRHKIAFGSFEDDTRTHGCSWGERKESE